MSRHRQKEKRQVLYSSDNFTPIVEKLKERGVPQERVTLEMTGDKRERIVNQIPLRTFPIMIGIPMDELMYSEFFLMFMRNLHIMPWDALSSTLSTYLPDARNRVHNTFLSEERYSHLFMIDSDVMCPPSTIERLMNHKQPIVAGWYKDKHPTHPNHPIVYDFVSQEVDGPAHWKHRSGPGEGLERVDGVGAGCVLMTREVAEKLGKDPYDMQRGGEDLVMCRKLMKLDIPLYVDWTVNCAHLGVQWT